MDTQVTPVAQAANTTVSKEKKIYVGLASRILNLLIAGCTQVQVSHALGVSEAYVSQLMGEEDFRLQISEAIQKDFEKVVAIDNNYLSIEKDLSEKLRAQLGYMHSPDQILKVLRFVNDAKKHSGVGAPVVGGTNGHSAPGQNGGVTLVLPQIIVKNFVLNPNNEVVSVDGKELTTLNSESLNTLVAQRAEQRKVLTIDAEETKIPSLAPKSRKLTNEDLSNL